MIAIVDYGMGNLRSVQKAFESVGEPAVVTADPEAVGKASKLVLPGVGAFADAMAELRQRGLVEPIVEFIRSGKPFFGICLGLQLLFELSYEDGEHRGLGLVPGRVVRFPNRPGLKVPHMGWNQLWIRWPAPVLQGIPDGAYVYFVHSYYVEPADRGVIATETDYGQLFASSIWSDNIFATQFHPEKSQQVGLNMIRNFCRL